VSEACKLAWAHGQHEQSAVVCAWLLHRVLHANKPNSSSTRLRHIPPLFSRWEPAAHSIEATTEPREAALGALAATVNRTHGARRAAAFHAATRVRVELSRHRHIDSDVVLVAVVDRRNGLSSRHAEQTS